MAKPPRRPPPQTRKSDLPPGDAVASRAVLPRKRDPRQAGIFDAPLPAFIRPQLAKLVTEAPEGDSWAHELKFDGYRMHARIDRGWVKLITARSGLDWTAKYPGLAGWLKALPVATAYLDGELCAVRPDGTTSFSLMQAATEGQGERLVYFAFDLLHQDREDLLLKPLLERKARLAELLKGAPAGLQYSDHVVGRGAAFIAQACRLKAEGIVSKRVDAPYRPGDRSGAWLKAKCLNREEFIVIGWTDPEGSRPHLGAVLLAYYAPDGRLVYAGRAGTGMPIRELARLSARLKPLATDRMPLDVPPPRASRFGSPLVLSRVHWVRPELVAEVTYLEWTDDGLLRQVVYQGLREDKAAMEVRRDRPPVR
ncbi:MAG: bifunctional non-ous end joining protein LigD [Methylobacteriaceae bacterium]|jgi:bifunctional non-homologous end joining protein LigD|nr:bifunctional non-ous end joining protein LigD [Methylobacteriaceae bacterium]